MKSGRSWSLEARQATEVSSRWHCSVFALIFMIIMNMCFFCRYIYFSQSLKLPFNCINRILFHHCAWGSPELWVSCLFEERRRIWISWRLFSAHIYCTIVDLSDPIRYQNFRTDFTHRVIPGPLLRASQTETWDGQGSQVVDSFPSDNPLAPHCHLSSEAHCLIPLMVFLGYHLPGKPPRVDLVWFQYLERLLPWKVQVWSMLQHSKD